MAEGPRPMRCAQHDPHGAFFQERESGCGAEKKPQAKDFRHAIVSPS